MEFADMTFGPNVRRELTGTLVAEFETALDHCKTLSLNKTGSLALIAGETSNYRKGHLINVVSQALEQAV